MKRGTPNHPKFKRLCRRLGLPRYAGVGLLELAWQMTADVAPRGDLGRFDDADIAEAVDWQGDPITLVAALVEERWLDFDATHRLIVHDWPHHCDDGVHMKLARAGLTFCDGTRPKLNRLAKMERAAAEARYAQPVRTKRVRAVRTESARRGGSLAEPSQALPSPALPEEESAAAPAPPTPADLAWAWNTHCGTLPKAIGLSPTREQHCRARLKERPLEQHVETIKRVASTPFCRGQNKRGWRADFGWYISSPDVALKVLEGKYDDTPPGAAPVSERLQGLNAGITRPTAAAGA